MSPSTKTARIARSLPELDAQKQGRHMRKRRDHRTHTSQGDVEDASVKETINWEGYITDIQNDIIQAHFTDTGSGDDQTLQFPISKIQQPYNRSSLQLGKLLHCTFELSERDGIVEDSILVNLVEFES